LNYSGENVRGTREFAKNFFKQKSTSNVGILPEIKITPSEEGK